MSPGILGSEFGHLRSASAREGCSSIWCLSWFHQQWRIKAPASWEYCKITWNPTFTVDFFSFTALILKSSFDLFLINDDGNLGNAKFKVMGGPGTLDLLSTQQRNLIRIPLEWDMNQQQGESQQLHGCQGQLTHTIFAVPGSGQAWSIVTPNFSSSESMTFHLSCQNNSWRGFKINKVFCFVEWWDAC